MSSASSAVTYTSVYTDSEPGRVFWGADEELSDGEPIYPEYIPLEDEHILPAEEQPLPPVVSPTAESPGYVAESDLEEDPDEYEDDDTEDGLDENEEDEEEEEHLASADSIAAISLPPEAEVKRLLAMPTSSPSPLASLSPPSAEERLARCTAPAALPSPPLPPPLHMPPLIDRMDDIPETEMPPRKRLCLSTLGSRYEYGENSTARPTGGRGIDYGFVNTLDAKARRRGIGEVEYGIRDTWIDLAETVPELVPMTVGEVNTKVTELAEIHMIAHQETIQIVEDEAYVAREAWAYSIGLSQMQQTEIVELRETDHRRQAQMAETLRVMGDIRREMGDMQAELLALCGELRRAG
nr:hypothetical protein [Tanacetum cinerariifolium]